MDEQDEENLKEKHCAMLSNVLTSDKFKYHMTH